MICGAGAAATELPLSPDRPIITPTPIASTSVATPAISEALAVIRERRSGGGEEGCGGRGRGA